MSERKPEDRHDVWRWAADIMSGDGAAQRSAAHGNAVLHILTEGGRLWCSSGPSISFTAVPGRERYCPRCMTLCRDMLDDLWEDEEP